MEKIEDIKSTISILSRQIIENAKENTYNYYPDKLLYIENVVSDETVSNMNNQKMIFLKLLKTAKHIDIVQLSEKILINKNNIAWVDLHLSYVAENEVIIIANIIKQSNSDTMNFHAGYFIPIDQTDKFDLNWWIKGINNKPK